MNSQEQSSAEAAIRAFFDAMNAQDADAAVALTREDVVISFGGPNEFQGHEALRELATQVDEQLSAEITALGFEHEAPGTVLVDARRTDRWRSTGEIATEREIGARFSVDDDGQIARVEFV
jgi:ketosteroid isomerase-like protein